ncbi:hypothetical protein Pla52o_05050 [Novipirellula galeiformis]|uniref:Uncharacterized protein n=1 Tax=Novipirellula galeiformis TaxID=2528004 RepID=A0A5C6CQ85_9BACT|nr:hypothetical protein [Novipirellula galeiformis]TWU26652.1 hypothetical protein Pla52o_05050 [Novipirellula galeiformis]
MMRFAQTMIGGILLLTLSLAANSYAEEVAISKIEEDWEMVLNEPDPARHSPQVTFFTTPTNDPNRYFQLQFNHAVDADFSGGGFRVAAVENDQVLSSARSETRAALAADDDRVRWTSVLAAVEGGTLFAIKNGHSNQWGEFGGPEFLVRMNSDALSGLSQYHPQKSLDAVDIGLGANRVDSITLIEVRVFYVDGTVIPVPVNRHP